ncbi:hypothetical protein scyTo_0007140 [Scyliorhinus torazame]|uniref:Uncharacterized protein n=1 Tax=Scyliorhinus torazame TaxID=75743 RepID=A0A401NM33_SCYTO|nr:hypothetical protein [Scyliorhinus torazame]
MVQPADSKALTLGLLAGVGLGVAGLTLAVALYQRAKKRNGAGGEPAARRRAEFHNHLKAPEPSPRQADILEKLNGLIRSLEEVKGEVQSLKEAVPRLQERMRKELGPERSPKKRSSPGHTAAKKRKRSEQVPEDGGGDAAAGADSGSLSSEEAESEGGQMQYITEAARKN